MSSGVSDLLKRQPASEKHMEESDAIPWSQQVEEALYETLPSTTTDNKSSGLSTSTQFQNPPFIVRAETSVNEKQKKTYANGNVKDTKSRCTKQHSCNDSRWNACNCNEKGANISKLSYNIKKDNSTASQRMPREPQKPFFGNTSGNDDMKRVPNYSTAENLSVLNDTNSNKKKITWASIASQPAKPNKKNNNMVLKKKGPGMPPPPMIPGKHLDINAWEFSSNIPPSTEVYGPVSTPIPTSEHSNSNDDSDTTNRFRPTNIEQQSTFSRKQVNHYSSKPTKNIKVNRSVDSRERDRHYTQMPNEERSHSVGKNINCMQSDAMNSESYEQKPCEDSDTGSRVDTSSPSEAEITSHIVLKKLRDRNNYNPSEIDMEKAALSRFFVIKSYSEDDIHRSIKYEIWCSTDHGNKRLDEAFKERVKEGGNVMLFFSVNGSGHFCGMAQMMTSVDYKSTSSVWSQDKWKGKFKVKWIYVKDVPNCQLRHIRLENNDNKSVTNSRDTQEVPSGKGLQVLRVLHLYKHQTSIFDDFYHYEKKQEESVLKKPAQYDNFIHPSSSSNMSHNDVKDQNNDRVFGNFRERIISHNRGGSGGGGHHNFLGNRRYGKSMDMPSGKDDKDNKPNSQSNAAEREDNESHSLRRHTNLSSENCNNSNSKRNFRDILHMNNFNCNDSSVVGENNESKLT